MKHHPMEGGQEESVDVDLGDGHTLQWSEWKGERIGGIITHTKSDSPTGKCSGAFWISDAFLKENNRTAPIWKFNGDFNKPTLEPSFLCHCGDHGFVREGKWVRA